VPKSGKAVSKQKLEAGKVWNNAKSVHDPRATSDFIAHFLKLEAAKTRE